MKLFIPDSRVREKQRVCRETKCQEKRKKASQRKWREKHRDYWEIDHVEVETRNVIRAEKATYMRKYRRSHPEYVKKDNERRKRTRRVGKSTVVGVCRNKDERFVQVKEIKELMVELLPCRKQDVISVQIAEKNEVTCQLPAP